MLIVDVLHPPQFSIRVAVFIHEQPVTGCVSVSSIASLTTNSHSTHYCSHLRHAFCSLTYYPLVVDVHIVCDSVFIRKRRSQVDVVLVVLVLVLFAKPARSGSHLLPRQPSSFSDNLHITTAGATPRFKSACGTPLNYYSSMSPRSLTTSPTSTACNHLRV